MMDAPPQHVNCRSGVPPGIEVYLESVTIHLTGKLALLQAATYGQVAHRWDGVRCTWFERRRNGKRLRPRHVQMTLSGPSRRLQAVIRRGAKALLSLVMAKEV